MSSSIEEALANCLDRIEEGGATLEEALSLYPELRAELEPLLFLSSELRDIPKVEAPASLRGPKRPVFRRGEAATPVQRGWLRLLPAGSYSPRWAAPLVRVAAALAAVFAVTGGTIVASANSLPGEPLYPLKLAVENAQLALAPSDESRAELEMSFVARRMAEIQSAAEKGKADAVAKAVSLYEQKVEAAVSASQTAVPSAPADPTRVQETVRQNVAALQEVQEKLGNDRARAAIEAAIQRSTAAAGVKAEREGKKPPQARGEDAKEPVSLPVAASATATSTARPTATAGRQAEDEREAPGKAKGRQHALEERTPASSQLEEAEDEKNEAAGRKRPDSDRQERRNELQASGADDEGGSDRQDRATAVPTGTATPAPAPVRTATSLPTARPSATAESRNGDGGRKTSGGSEEEDTQKVRGGDKDKNESGRKNDGKENLVTSLLERLRSLSGNRGK